MRQEETYLYQAYLLRLWREDGSSHWRASMESPHTGQRFNFANLFEMIRFIEVQTGEKVENSVLRDGE
jgi:hypothetical protein